jgi:hypothetical protein
VDEIKIWCVTGFGVLGVLVLIPVGSRNRISELLIEKCVIGLYLLYTSQNLLGMTFRVTFAVLYRRIWSIVGNYSILCCDRHLEYKYLVNIRALAREQVLLDIRPVAATSEHGDAIHDSISLYVSK